ncbi:MAG: cation:proton antiporter [Alphaproteobacteria bacterium]|nr:cation:proton antiporter [Alphaproteobacteria bacterium]OJV12505.1 MAG: potassium transporter [Alphaproteobacteria bacterium 33-17]
MPHFDFLPILYLLGSAVIIVAIFRHLKLSPVLGYFVAGSMLGPSGFGVVDPKETMIFGEIGVVFLLFAIGLELTFSRLKAMRNHVFGFGTLQVTLTTAIILGVLLLLSVKGGKAFIIGAALALSSTAIVLQVLAESRTQSTQVGRLSLATLLMQDFAVVPLLVLVPLIAEGTTNFTSSIFQAFSKAIIALFFIFVGGRLLLRPLFNAVTTNSAAKNNELFVATTILISLAAAYITEQLGLSLALGAFAAGLLVAETEFQHQAEESIFPFKGLFLGLFFMTVGMSMDLNFMANNYVKIILISLALIVVKATVITALCMLFRFSLGTSIHAGLLLSQGGEFAFILFKLAQSKGILNAEISQVLLMVVTTTMALTPLLSAIGTKINERLDRKADMKAEDIIMETDDLENHVIIVGFGRVGKMVARLLEAESVHYLATDINEEYVTAGRQDGFPVYLGDSSSIRMLETLGIARAQSVIITIKNTITINKTIQNIREKYQNIPIIMRSEDLSEDGKLYDMGASILVPETYETGLQLGGAVLKAIGFSEFEISRIKNKFRAGNYEYAKEAEIE